METFEQKFEEFNRSYKLFEPKQSILIAVSGGIDSMAMLHFFVKISGKYNLQVAVVHVNHQLRGKESSEDEQFVKQIAQTYHVPFYCERVDVVAAAHSRRLSKQAAARQLRYDCFERIRQKIKAQVVATAHHADDNAETVLFNIVRGTGVHGLSGIPVRRADACIIRPLLFASRSEIEDYARHAGISFREDSSNRSLMYTRNMIRRKILPVLMKRHPDIMRTLNSTATVMREVNEKLQVLVIRTLNNLIITDSQENIKLSITAIMKEPEFIQDEIFRAILQRLEIEPTESKILSLHKLCTQPTGRSIAIGSGVSAHRDRETLVLRKVGNIMDKLQEVVLGESYDYQGYHITLGKPEPVPASFAKSHEVEYIDGDRLGNQLILRTWRPGDWFIPLGMKKKKKLSDFFTDQKIPRYQKTSIPVLESDGNIVWVCGRRLDNRYKLTEHTRAAIRLTYQPFI